MLWNKLKDFIPKQLLFQLTFINTFVIAVFVGLSSLAIYNSACMLAEGIISMSSQKQVQFETTLFHYLLIFSISMIITGSLIHFYLTKKLTKPLRELIHSTKQVKYGDYPKPIETKPKGEIGELVGQFNDLVKQLELNEQYRKQLVSDLSHEFRTPLSNLNGYLRALESGVVDGDLKLYRALYKETRRLIDLVEQMEQLKEWDHVSTSIYLKKSPANVKELVEQAVAVFRWKIEKSGIEVDVEVEPSIVKVNSNSIAQVLSNLLDNAIRYYEGTGPLIIKGIELSEEYELRFTAPGSPIPSKEKEQIFERFYRIDRSRSRYLGGSGLGLAISKEIIEQHQGKIGVTSDGKIHTFWFRIPREI